MTVVSADEPLLEINDLTVSFASAGGRVRAANGVNLTIRRGEVLAILGESGSGKSVSAAAVMGLIDTPPGSIDRGAIKLNGRNLFDLSTEERRKICGDKISLIFQDALAALNPVFQVGWQVAEIFRIHGKLSRTDAIREAVKLLERVGFPDPKQQAKRYPHQLSGGMRQRVVIAMAVALRPDLIIADEPTTALDVTVQAQIIELLSELRRDSDSSLIFITHDLGVVAEIADRVAVMYGGRVVETACVEEIFARPQHPYTRGLLDSQPRIDRPIAELIPIPGSPPNPANLPSGCAFRPRCPLAADICSIEVPRLRPTALGGAAACHMIGDDT